MYDLISASPSPYARKIRIALPEKGIPFNLKTEVPWNSTTETPKYNPLEKLPVLISQDGKAVYESHYIFEWIEAKHPEPPLLPTDIDERLFAKKVEVVADQGPGELGICDALVLCFIEKMRDADKQSEPWKTRQMRKVDGGLQALATWVDESDGKFLVGDRLTHCSLHRVRLSTYWENLDARASFANTRPSPQNITDQIV